MFITADDAAIGDLRYLPHVQRLLVDRGTRFSNAIAPPPLCVPTRATLLTGQYAHNHGARSISGTFGGFASFRDNRTLPVWLRHDGYHTMFVGKYLNGYGDVKDGNDPTYVPPGWANWHGSVDPTTYQYARARLNRNGHVSRVAGYNTNVFADEANRMLANAPRRRPWFMWVSYVGPHAGGPVDPDDPTIEGKRSWTPSPAPRYRNDFRGTPLPDKPNMFEADVTDKDVLPQHPQWDLQGRADLREDYQQRLETLQSVDDAVARHVRLLRRLGELGNTVVVFTSDNGFMVGEHRMLGKLWHVRESLQVPLVIRGPGVPVGLTAHTLVSGVDLPVTFAAAAGVTPGRVVDGIDVLPLVRAEHLSGMATERVLPIEAFTVKGGEHLLYTGIRVGDRFTYARHRDGSEDLFDLVADPYELLSVDADPAYADVLTAAREFTAAFQDCAGGTCQTDQAFPPTP